MRIETNREAREAALGPVHALLQQQRPLKVLEAGGGAAAHFPYGPHVEVTVLDASPEALARNTYAQHAIVGDLHTVELPGQSFDLVVCWDVLEHLERPDLVVQRLAQAVAPGGLLALASPNPLSLSGLFVKLTPHWVHVLYYRVIERSSNAGKPGYAPFKTYLKLSIRVERLVRQLGGLGLRPVGVAKYATLRREHIHGRSALAGFVLDAALWAGKLGALGRWRPELGDYVLVAQREAEPVAAGVDAEAAAA
jgi:SAM-dependent methyltransferase